MISIQEARMAMDHNQPVVYIPFSGCCKSLHERGVITSITNFRDNIENVRSIAFVRYGDQKQSKATELYDLMLIEEYNYLESEKAERERIRKEQERVKTRADNLELD